MQFVVHRDPVATSGWATALGATGDAINNVLQIYTNYKQDQKAQAQRDLENQWKQEDMDMRKQEAANRDAAQQFEIDKLAREVAIKEAQRSGKRPEVDSGVQVLPTRQVTLAPGSSDVQSIAPAMLQGEVYTGGALPNWMEKEKASTVAVPEVRFKDRVVAPGRTEAVTYEDDRLQAEIDKAVQSGDRLRMTPAMKEYVKARAQEGDLSVAGFIPFVGEQDVMSPQLYADLTRQMGNVQAKAQPRTQTVGKALYVEQPDGSWKVAAREKDTGDGSGSKKPPTAGERSRLTDFRQSLNILGNLTDTVSDTGTIEWAKTKVPNIISQWTGWGEDAKSRNASLLKAKQIIGKAMEGGVLRKEDEAKYEKMLPNIKDTPNQARAKLADLVSQMIEDAQIYLDDLDSFGIDTGSFRSRLVADVDRYRGISARHKSESQAAGGGAAAAGGSTGSAEEWTTDANGNPVRKAKPTNTSTTSSPTGIRGRQ